MLTINSLSPWEMISGFNLTATRSEKRQGMKLCSSLRTICDSTWPDQFHGWKLREETRSDGRQPLSAISATCDVNEYPLCGNFNVVLWWVKLYFFLSCFPDTKQLIDILLKSKQLFTKRLFSLRFLLLLLEIEAVNIFSLSPILNCFLTLKFKFPL